MPLSMTGVVGKVTWGYYNAAAINGYAVTRNGSDWSLRATVIASDAYNLAQRPLVFVAPHQKGEWRWPVLEFQMVNGSFTAKLGPPVE